MDTIDITNNITDSNVINEKFLTDNFKLKVQNLTAMAKSVLDNPKHKDELKRIISKLNLTTEEVIRTYVEYDLDLYAYGNEVYAPLVMRVVLYLHNLLEKSWHIEGQQTVQEYIELAKPNTLADLGFGTPATYVKQALKNKKPKITLCDGFEPAFTFAKVLLNEWDAKWSDIVSFKTTDMDKEEFIGEYDLYLFLDSIEHVPNPASYLRKYVELSPPHAQFIFSLPIAPLVPVHYISWSEPYEALNWLEECGLNTKEYKLISVNPEVDLFAEQFDFNYRSLTALCSKKA